MRALILKIGATLFYVAFLVFFAFLGGGNLFSGFGWGHLCILCFCLGPPLYPFVLRMWFVR